jgi:hypothetical protein
MGKVYDKIIASNILNAKDIACVVSANHLIIASVSNWGGYALAAAIGLISLKGTMQPEKNNNTHNSNNHKSSLNNNNNNSSNASLAVTHNVQDYKSFMVRKDVVGDAITKFMPTNEEEIAKCARIISAGARDGITGKLEMMVDGMAIEVSLALMDEFRNIGEN